MCMRATVRLSILVGLALLSVGAGAWADEAPVAVSPGAAAETVIAERCPTFSWGQVGGALTYEVAVYEVGLEGGEAPPVLTEPIPGAALAWTPPLVRCFEHGRSYAWSVRAETGKGMSGWAAPLFFKVSALPTSEEFKAAVEVVQRYLSAGNHEMAREMAGPTSSAEEEEAEGFRAAPSGVVPNGPAALMIEGEVRTVDASELPRLWGRGRDGVDVYPSVALDLPCLNGDLRYGLSTADVSWGAAADGCPVGTWVCPIDGLLACNTTRPDDSTDGRTCDGTARDFSEAAHVGWVQGLKNGQGHTFSESAFDGSALSCELLPVWCCWEVD